MRRIVVVKLLVICVAAAVGCREHGRRRGDGRINEDSSSDDEHLTREWNEEYDENSDFSEQEDERSRREEETAESSPQVATTVLRSQPQINSRHYGTPSHRHGGYGAKSYGSVSLKPVAIAIECTVMDPLEHIVWLQARCPDEYDRGNVIAKGSVSNIPSLFSVSVNGTEGTFVSTLTIDDPIAHGAGGVFRCEAWPHPGYGRHKRELTPTLVGENPEEMPSREGRALQDPWNAIILGGAELIEECFYGSYDDKWRKLRKLEDNPSTSMNFQTSARKLDKQQTPFVPMQMKEMYLLEEQQQESTPNTPYTFDNIKFVPTTPPITNSAYTPLSTVAAVTPSMQQPNQPNVQLYQTYNKQESESTEKKDGILLSDLSNPEIRLQFLRNLSPEQLKIWHETFPSERDVDKVVVPTSSMIPIQRIFNTAGRSTPTVRITNSDGLELKTNMPTLQRFAKSRMINFLPENTTQTS